MGNPPQNRKNYAYAQLIWFGMHHKHKWFQVIQIVMSSLWHHSQAEANKYPSSHIPVIWDVLGTMFFRRNIHLLGHRNPRSGATAAGSSSLWSVDVISRIRERFTTWTSYLRCPLGGSWGAGFGPNCRFWNLKMWGANPMPSYSVHWLIVIFP